MKRVTMASGILLGLGFFLTAHSSSLMMLWLSAGVLVGLADGAGYLLTLSNCVKWFPERKGLISAFSTVSYTHLDVYKRQKRQCAIRCTAKPACAIQWCVKASLLHRTSPRGSAVRMNSCG